MDVVPPLLAEARRTDERRLLVVTGSKTATREFARTALETANVDSEATTLLGPQSALECEQFEQVHANRLLGRTREAVVFDAHEEFRPNALGQSIGAVDGGGLFVLLVPPLETWTGRHTAFDETLAIPPFGIDAVTAHHRRRIVEALRTHPGIAIVDADTGTVERDGLTHPAQRRPPEPPSVPVEHRFPAAAYEACLTGDQARSLGQFEALSEPGNAVVVEADRGRGKSSAAGLAAGSLAAAGNDVLVTAPQYASAAEVFARAGELLDELGRLDGVDREDNPHRLDAGEGCVRYEPATAAVETGHEADVVIVDEAAALPVRILSDLLGPPSVAFTTTIHGYEGAGRGFSVRFRDRLADSDYAVTEATMSEPIRYAAGDPVEVWATRALLLDARPPVEPLVEAATPETVSYRRLDAAALMADEHLLRETFGLLVLAHYRTEPADLARLLDAPNVAVRALCHEGHVVSVALLAREGDLSDERRASMYRGERVRGNMLPDVLTTQLRDEDAGVPVGWRVMRIATHPAVRQRGLGSALLDAIEEEAEGDLDWLGVGYGATPDLLSFWEANGFRTVHVSTTRNERSGEHSAIMLRPLSAAGRELHDRHAAWFCRRVAGMLSDPLAALDADVVRAALAATESQAPLDVDDREWKLLAGSPFGAGLFDTAPEPFRRLALHALTAGDGPTLSARRERLLVRKCFQATPWEEVADELDFHSRRECMRELGATVETLVQAYGPETARAEMERFR